MWNWMGLRNYFLKYAAWLSETGGNNRTHNNTSWNTDIILWDAITTKQWNRRSPSRRKRRRMTMKKGKRRIPRWSWGRYLDIYTQNIYNIYIYVQADPGGEGRGGGWVYRGGGSAHPLPSWRGLGLGRVRRQLPLQHDPGRHRVRRIMDKENFL